MTDVHTHFGLSYANYLVKPRTLLQSMPDEWQHRFVACLQELDAAFAHVEQAPGYKVEPVDWRQVRELTETERTAAGVTMDCDEEDEAAYHDRDGNEIDPHFGDVAVPTHEPIPHYNRGRTHIPPNLDATAPAKAPELGTGELGTWKPEVISIVGILRELDWTSFSSANLDDLADVAAAVAGALFPTPPLELLPPTE